MEGIDEIIEYVSEQKLAQLRETIESLSQWSEEFSEKINKVESKINTNTIDINTLSKSKNS